MRQGQKPKGNVKHKLFGKRFQTGKYTFHPRAGVVEPPPPLKKFFRSPIPETSFLSLRMPLCIILFLSKNLVLFSLISLLGHQAQE